MRHLFIVSLLIIATLLIAIILQTNLFILVAMNSKTLEKQCNGIKGQVIFLDRNTQF